MAGMHAQEGNQMAAGSCRTVCRILTRGAKHAHKLAHLGLPSGIVHNVHARAVPAKAVS